MKQLTVEMLKELKPGQWLMHTSMQWRAKVNGLPQTWKTRPNDVRVPMKHGLKHTFQMGTAPGLDSPPTDWLLPETYEEEQVKK